MDAPMHGSVTLFLVRHGDSIIDAFRARNIEIPFPQQEVRLLNPAVVKS